MYYIQSVSFHPCYLVQHMSFNPTSPPFLCTLSVILVMPDPTQALWCVCRKYCKGVRRPINRLRTWKRHLREADDDEKASITLAIRSDAFRAFIASTAQISQDSGVTGAARRPSLTPTAEYHPQLDDHQSEALDYHRVDEPSYHNDGGPGAGDVNHEPVDRRDDDQYYYNDDDSRDLGDNQAPTQPYYFEFEGVFRVSGLPENICKQRPPQWRSLRTLKENAEQGLDLLWLGVALVVACRLDSTEHTLYHRLPIHSEATTDSGYLHTTFNRIRDSTTIGSAGCATVADIVYKCFRAAVAVECEGNKVVLGLNFGFCPQNSPTLGIRPHTNSRRRVGAWVTTVPE
ncbi:hypothetical protein EDD15DRAFT_2203753 [Pisolithus albus]|nr:hypothetical protein EDD15DRAFT_2203753 [Pisolithus albus]